MSSQEATYALTMEQDAQETSLLTTITLETAAYIALGVLALLLRFYNLGAAPLTAAESHEALAAWRLATGAAYLAPHSQLLNTLLTITFWTFGASATLARVWPALAGALLVFTPALFRRELGRPAALLATGFLTVSPTLLAASRTADGATLALLCLLGVVAGWRGFADRGRLPALRMSGIVLGAGLAAGPRFVAAVVVLGIASSLQSMLAGETGAWRKRWRRVQPHLAQALVPAGISFALIASLALLNRGGLSAAGAAIPTWLAGWALTPTARSVFLVPSLLALYEPLALVLGLAGIYLIRQKDETARALLVYALIGLVFGIAYSGRQSSDVLFVSLPLTMLAALAVVHGFRGEWTPGELELTAGQATVLLLLLVFAGLNLANFASNYQANNTEYDLTPLYLAAGVMLLLVIVVLLFAAGWTARVSLRATIGVMLLSLLLITFRAAWGVSQAHAGDPRELWASSVVSPNVRLLVATLEDVSLRHMGDAHELEMTVLGDRDGPLGWQLRNFRKLQWVDALSPLVDSPVVITDAEVSDPTLGSSYLGQEFAVYSRWNERLPQPAAAVGYVLFRYTPIEHSRMVVWVREDVQLLEER